MDDKKYPVFITHVSTIIIGLAALLAAEHRAKLSVDNTQPSDNHNDGEYMYLPAVGGKCLLLYNCTGE